VVGQGSLDLVLVPGFLSNLDVLREQPGHAHLVKRLSAFARVILFDKRGTGLSDRVDLQAPPDPAAHTADILAVMDATGCGRATLLGESDGAALALLFAQQHPQRVRSLVLYGGYAHFHGSVMDARRQRALLDTIDTTWGQGATLALLAPGRASDPSFAEWWARFERLSASPTDAATLVRMNAAIDLRGQLAGLSAPALLLHRIDDPYAALEGGRALAHAIAGARLIELAGREHPIWLGEVDPVADRVEEFLTGTRPLAGSERVLAMALVVRLGGAGGRNGAAHPDERVALFQQQLPRLMQRHGGPGRMAGCRQAGRAFRRRGARGGCGDGLARGRGLAGAGAGPGHPCR